MSYSIVQTDIINVDQLMDQIRSYIEKFRVHEDFFIHCKNVEKFERNLERNVPDLSYQIAQIYASGRDVAISVQSHISEYTYQRNYSLLKTAIDKLEFQLVFLKEFSESEIHRISGVYNECGYDEWSVNHMLKLSLQMCEEINEIQIYINTIKASYTYQIQSGVLTMEDVRRMSMPEINSTSYSGTFTNSQISNGDNNNNQMTVNQAVNEELGLVCQKLIEIVENSQHITTEDKTQFKSVVLDIKDSTDETGLKSAYQNFMSFLSNHITVGTAVLGSQLLPELTKLIG